MSDCERRNLYFPCLPDLKAVLRSTSTGQNLTQKCLESPYLQREFLAEILVHPVNWTLTVDETLKTLNGSDRDTSHNQLTVESYGPMTKGLFSYLKKSHESPNIQLMDFYDEIRAYEATPTSSSDISIIGMSVRLPKGNGDDELWNTVMNGVSAVQEVCPACEAHCFMLLFLRLTQNRYRPLVFATPLSEILRN